jgi:hypothetical protein
VTFDQPPRPLRVQVGRHEEAREARRPATVYLRAAGTVVHVVPAGTPIDQLPRGVEASGDGYDVLVLKAGDGRNVYLFFEGGGPPAPGSPGVTVKPGTASTSAANRRGRSHSAPTGAICSPTGPARYLPRTAEVMPAGALCRRGGPALR